MAEPDIRAGYHGVPRFHKRVVSAELCKFRAQEKFGIPAAESQIIFFDPVRPQVVFHVRWFISQLFMGNQCWPASMCSVRDCPGLSAVWFLPSEFQRAISLTLTSYLREIA